MRRIFSVRIIALSVVVGAATAQDVCVVIDPRPVSNPTNNLPEGGVELARALVTFAEQQKAMRETLEQLRAKSEASTADAEKVAARLKTLERVLAGEHELQFEAIQDAQRQTVFTMRIAGAVGLAGVIAGFVLMTLFLRVLRQMTEISRQLISPGAAPAASRVPVPVSGIAAAIAELEKRVSELESPVVPAAVLPHSGSERGPQTAPVSEAGEIQALIARGKASLAAGNAREALDCFDAVLRFQGTHVEALVRQGRALEALGRSAEAVESYGLALAADPGLAATLLGKTDVVTLFEHSAMGR